jgi:asparagine synthase (glutamine-hydrolysing)
LIGLDTIAPAEAWELNRAAAVRLDAMSDPIALAALSVGESSFEQGVRISGLGGEVARGFYYLGKVRERPVTKAEAHQLAAWRMFVNEAVEPGLLNREFADWGRQAADNEVFLALASSGKDWDRATDDLYLRHRMQRWAGVTDTAVAYQRTVINPMLDHEFLDIASRLAPADKANSLFLARLQMELDPELGHIPLEGRPAPVRYAEPSLRNDLNRRIVTGRRLARKAFQRIRRGNRPPAGGDILADKVVSHWRLYPSIVEPARASGFVRAEWLDGMLDGTIRPRPSSVAFLTNMIITAEVAENAQMSTSPTNSLSNG